MTFGIVEGEPGIFPDPIARVMRAIARLVRRDRPRQQDRDDPPATEEPLPQ